MPQVFKRAEIGAEDAVDHGFDREGGRDPFVQADRGFGRRHAVIELPRYCAGQRSGVPSGLRPSSFVMFDTPVEVKFTSAGCLIHPCRTPLMYASLEIESKIEKT